MERNGLDHSGRMEDWKFPLILSILAGASTSIGAGIVFVFSPEVIQRSMSFSLSLAASVMITVSVISIGPECLDGVISIDPTSWQVEVITTLLLQRVVFFVLGCFSYLALSKLLGTLPEPESLWNGSDLSSVGVASSPLGDDMEQGDSENSNLNRRTTDDDVRNLGKANGPTLRAVRRGTVTRESSGSVESMTNVTGDNASMYDEKNKALSTVTGSTEDRRRSWRVAMLLFVSLLCHNFPEGLAVVASTVESRELGVTVAVGIMIHNIPEGIAIAVPCMAARPDAPWLAFWLATLSGIAEPLGALLALIVLRSSSSHSVHIPLEDILACVAGIMCMVAAIELYPEALNHVKHQNYRGIVSGTLVGMIIMIATECYLP